MKEEDVKVIECDKFNVYWCTDCGQANVVVFLEIETDCEHCGKAHFPVEGYQL